MHYRHHRVAQLRYREQELEAQLAGIRAELARLEAIDVDAVEIPISVDGQLVAQVRRSCD